MSAGCDDSSSKSPDVKCSLDTDCATRTDGKTSCDVTKGECVKPEGTLEKECKNDTDCAGNTVSGRIKCDTTQGVCIQPCGDGFVDLNEDCEPSNFKSLSCDELPDGHYLGGDVSCTANCKYNTSMCYECTEDDVTKCPSDKKKCISGTCVDPNHKITCGDGVAEGSETCDVGNGKADYRGLTCADSGFRYGELGCKNCQAIDLSGCYQCKNADDCDGTDVCQDGVCRKNTEKCGNGVLDDDEWCDGNLFLDGETACAAWDNYIGGNVICSSTCEFDLSRCYQCTQSDTSKCSSGQVCSNYGTCIAAPTTCNGKGQTQSGSVCACDTSNHWTGTVPNCTCADNYVEVDGACVRKADCPLNEKWVAPNNCVCNEANNWTGTHNNCRCKDNYEQIATNACASIKCDGIGEIKSGNACVCDKDEHWTGERGACVCETGYEVFCLASTCMCFEIKCDKQKEVFDAVENTCKCNNENGYYGEERDKCCPVGYYYNSYYRDCKKIECASNEVFDKKTNSCICNAEQHWFGEAGNCQCDGTIISAEELYENPEGKADQCWKYFTVNGHIPDENGYLIESHSEVAFGKYPQSGTEKEDLIWYVVSIDPSKRQMLLYSKYIIDAKPFNEFDEDHYLENDNSWGGCSLRNWLNGEFLSTAFTPEEQANIAVTENGFYYQENSWEGYTSSSEDKVFLPTNEQYFDASWIAGPWAYEQRFDKRKATTYAVNHGLKIVEPEGKTCANGECTAKYFWLRSPVKNQYTAAMVVKEDGVTEPYTSSESIVLTVADEHSGYLTVYYDFVGIRPAIWVKY